jgi:geranylgeranyl pyrophosphate synthase
MDIYRLTVDYLLNVPILGTWQEMETVLRRAASGCPRDWQLPIIACQAVGASPEKAIPASAALACVQLSIILVDDMLDEYPRGEYLHVGNGRAANLAVAFQAAGLDALLESRADIKIKQKTICSLNQMISKTAFGQELDIQNLSDESSYWRVVQNKSAPFFGCAIYLGAIFGEATSSVARELEQLGKLYGEMIQIHDDLNDSLAVPANPDWLKGRKPLPILFAELVNHPERARFVELCRDISAEDALQEAQEILIRCGAVSYCVDQLLRRHQTAQGILNKLPLPKKAAVEALMEAVIAPVRKLFETLGISRSTLVGSGVGSDNS